jgi:hypothetical protein
MTLPREIQPNGVILPPVYNETEADKGKPKPLKYYKQAIGLGQAAMQHPVFGLSTPERLDPLPLRLYPGDKSLFDAIQTNWVEVEIGLLGAMRKVVRNANCAVTLNEVDYGLVLMPETGGKPFLAALVPYEHTEPQTIHYDTALMNNGHDFDRDRDEWALKIMETISTALDSK